MRTSITYITCVLLMIACKNVKSTKSQDVIPIETTKNLQSGDENKFATQATPFKRILQFPTIKDTANFILELRQNCNLGENDPFSNIKNQTISFYKKVNIYGSNDECILLEYDYKDGTMASFPWKYQFLFSRYGKLIKVFDADRFELVKVFPNEHPLLMTLSGTAKGNGGHDFFKLNSDTLESVFDGFSDYFPRTYDDNEDNNINQPYELNLNIEDENRDGLNDIVFSGAIIHSRGENQKKKVIPVKFIFLFNKLSGHFVEKEDYSKKYIHLDK